MNAYIMPDLQHISIPHSLMLQFDAISARLHCQLLRSFISLHNLARQRMPSPTAISQTPMPQRTPTAAQTRSTQTRLTTLWQVPPPYIADAPAPCPTPKCTQQLLTKYVTTTAAAALPTAHLITPTAMPDDHHSSTTTCATLPPTSTISRRDTCY